MRIIISSITTVLLLGSLALAEESAKETPLTALPYTSGLDVTAMDRSANPCADFYQYTCGGWIKNNPIPSDRPGWSVYAKVGQDNERFLWGILQNLAPTKVDRSANQKKIGDYFAACMDEAAVEKAGTKPLDSYFAAIDGMKTTADLPAVFGKLQLEVPGFRGLFGFGSDQDPSDSKNIVAVVGAEGLGLPDKDYYLRPDSKSKELRAKYLTHLQKMFQLVGYEAPKAKESADRVMKFETFLAKATLSRVARRDPYNLFHKMKPAELKAITSHFKWDDYLNVVAEPSVREQLTVFNVLEPNFIHGMDELIAKTPMPELQNYLKWQVMNSMAPLLSKAMVDENFDFNSRTLTGAKELSPRWKRCVQLVDAQIGEALGQEFVDRTFSAEQKAKTLAMTEQVEGEMRKDIKALDWMTAKTKAKAMEKLDTIVNKIGYPDTWRDYSALVVDQNDFVANVEHGHTFELRRQLAKIGKPLDRKEWQMTPPTVNAEYNAQMNDINFPAGVLQPPLFDPKMEDAPNYGNTGATIGHELTHAFDDEGRKFDARGNLKEWWTPKDASAFEERASCIVKQYKQYPVVDELKINSQLTEGEDIADLGGLILAWMAWKDHAAIGTEKIDDLTPEQRFFVGYSQWACENTRPEAMRLHALTNEHSPGKYRVNGLMVNMPEFQKAFNCKAGDKMVAATRCRVW